LKLSEGGVRVRGRGVSQGQWWCWFRGRDEHKPLVLFVEWANGFTHAVPLITVVPGTSRTCLTRSDRESRSSQGQWHSKTKVACAANFQQTRRPCRWASLGQGTLGWSLGKWRAAAAGRKVQRTNNGRTPRKMGRKAIKPASKQLRHLTAEGFSPRCCCAAARSKEGLVYSKDPRNQ
jgi:hypothetical protein